MFPTLNFTLLSVIAMKTKAANQSNGRPVKSWESETKDGEPERQHFCCADGFGSLGEECLTQQMASSSEGRIKAILYYVPVTKNN